MSKIETLLLRLREEGKPKPLPHVRKVPKSEPELWVNPNPQSDNLTIPAKSDKASFLSGRSDALRDRIYSAAQPDERLKNRKLYVPLHMSENMQRRFIGASTSIRTIERKDALDNMCDKAYVVGYLAGKAIPANKIKYPQEVLTTPAEFRTFYLRNKAKNKNENVETLGRDLTPEEESILKADLETARKSALKWAKE